jgi:predicted nucleic acid-binding protein
MGPIVLDTSVVVAALNPDDAHHRSAVAELTARRVARQPIKISTVVIAELHSVKRPRQAAWLAWIDRFVDSLGADAVISVDRPTAELAGAARAKKPSLKLPDALIKATADQLGGELLTADRKLAKLDGVTLIG